MTTKKERELVETAAVALEGAYGTPLRVLAPEIVRALAEVTPPEVDDDLNLTFEMLTVRPGGGRSGRSVKPGNVLLNLRKVVAAVANGVLTAVGVAAAPWTAVLGALVVWDSVYSCVEAELDDFAASVVWTLWRHADDAHTVSKAGLLELVNSERSAHNSNLLTPQQLRQALRDLERMRCIRTSDSDTTRWVLRESVRVDYR